MDASGDKGDSEPASEFAVSESSPGASREVISGAIVLVVVSIVGVIDSTCSVDVGSLSEHGAAITEAATTKASERRCRLGESSDQPFGLLIVAISPNWIAPNRVGYRHLQEVTACSYCSSAAFPVKRDLGLDA